MTALIVGANGQLGQQLQKYLTELNREFIAWGSKELDITKRDLVMSKITELNPDIIYDTAAYTAVDKAEDEGRDLNWKVNEIGSTNLAEAAKAVDATIVYVSTDYVFDGTKDGEYLESDETNPMNEYGKAKLAGEKGVAEYAPKHYTVRTSWVFGEFGNNFVYTMQRLAESHPKLTVVNDQLGRPTWTRTLAEFMVHLVDTKQEYGIYNLSNDNSATWYDFAREILKDTDVEVAPVTSAEFPQKAYRPKKSVMNLEKAKSTGFVIPTWEDALDEHLER